MYDDAHKAFPQRTLTTTPKTEPVAESVSVALSGLSSHATPSSEGPPMASLAVTYREFQPIEASQCCAASRRDTDARRRNVVFHFGDFSDYSRKPEGDLWRAIEGPRRGGGGVRLRTD